MKQYDVLVIGAGAAGLMCAWEAGKRGRRVLMIEHTRKIAEKIRISGGGRSNFTNLYCSPHNFLSQNPHFCKSALSRFTPQDFLALVDAHGIAWHEKPYEEKAGNENARGQLFCTHSAGDLIDMLHGGCKKAGVEFALETKVLDVVKTDHGFAVQTDHGEYSGVALVVASGGLSIPKIGASNFGYELAKRFGLRIVSPRPALVPLTFDDDLLARTKPLSGLSVDAAVSCKDGCFREGLLFTHRGLSGPSILQASSYWREGEEITVNLLPDRDALDSLRQAREVNSKQQLRNVLSQYVPARLAEFIVDYTGVDGRMADLSDKKLQAVSEAVGTWRVRPAGSEGYRTAEVTLGGVDTRDMSSKTFEAVNVPGLYFIGEVLDVTGHLGGHNFQWAWSSGWACGQVA